MIKLELRERNEVDPISFLGEHKRLCDKDKLFVIIHGRLSTVPLVIKKRKRILVPPPLSARVSSSQQWFECGVTRTDESTRSRGGGR